MTRFKIPAELQQRRSQGEPWVSWLDGLSRTFTELIDDWQLIGDSGTGLEGPVWHGYCSVVLPVRTTSGSPAVLKVSVPDDETRDEHLALQQWGGHGAVRLLRADPHRRALLLERLHRESLSDVWDIEACEIVGDLYGQLHRPAAPMLRALSSAIAGPTQRLAELPRTAPLPRRMVEHAIALGREFMTDPSTDGILIHTDLHYDNVLAADREPWLAIDPKPLSGDPHYEVAPLLWNRWAEVTGDVRGSVRRRFHAAIDAAGLDEDRARDWVIVRMMHNALWRLEDPPHVQRLTATDEWLTLCISVAKAVSE